MTKRWDRALIFGLLLALVISMAAGFDNRCEAVRENVLRLHILANSDSEEDQALKLRVRDAILRETAESFAQSGSREETGRLARALLPKIEETARATLEAAGCTDAVRAGLVHMYFDTREYDGTILPAGYYDAVRIELGRAEGRNWWCVLFPQLCIGTAADCAGLEQIEQLAEGPEYRGGFAGGVGVARGGGGGGVGGAWAGGGACSGGGRAAGPAARSAAEANRRFA